GADDDLHAAGGRLSGGQGRVRELRSVPRHASGVAQPHARGDGGARQYGAVPRGRLALLPGAALAEPVTPARRPLSLAALPLTRLGLMAAAGREVVAAERALAKQGFNMV